MIAHIKDRFPEVVEIVFSFPVAHIGWELDNEYYICKTITGENILITTSHGGAYKGEKGELEEKIAEYSEWIEKTRKAISLL